MIGVRPIRNARQRRVRGAGARCRRRSRRRGAPIVNGAARDVDQLEAGVGAGARAGAAARSARRGAGQARELDRLQHRLVVLLLVADDQLVQQAVADAVARRVSLERARAHRRRGSRARLGAVAGTAARRARRAASRTRRRSRPGPRAAAARPPKRCTSHRSSNAAMCPRSHTSGLIKVEWTRSRSSSDTGATSASVRSRASARPSASLRGGRGSSPAALGKLIGAIVASSGVSGSVNRRSTMACDLASSPRRVPQEQRALALEHPEQRQVQQLGQGRAAA